MARGVFISATSRHLVVDQRFNHGRGPKAFAKKFGKICQCSERSARRIVEEWNRDFSIASDQRRGRPCPWTQEEQDIIRDFIAYKPNCYLDELCEYILLRLERHADESTICRLLKKMGYTSKVISRIFFRQNEAQRVDFWIRMRERGYKAEHLVFLDESSFQDRYFKRKYGKAPR
jgi:transposase